MKFLFLFPTVLRAIFVMVLAVLCLDCTEMEHWTARPDVRLRFSRDTLAFDTVLAGQASSTRVLLAYNDAKDGIRIRSVRLSEGAKSHFRINVDGQFLYEGRGEDYFEVRGHDSIYIRAFAILPPNEGQDVQLYEDELVFTLESGVTQRVPLCGMALNVNELHGLVCTSDTVFKAARPYQVFDSLVVAQGCTLSLPAGCTLMMHDGAQLIVRGTLRVQGTPEKPVVLRSDRTDRMFPYLPYDNTPNRWGGVWLTTTSRDNELVQLDLHSSNYGIRVDSIDYAALSNPVLRLENSVLHNIGGPGLELHSTRAEIIGTQISNTLGNVVSQEGGDVLYVHCTLAQFYPFSAKRGSALWLSNKRSVGDRENEVPLSRAHFLNCLLTGYAEDVIQRFLTVEKVGMPPVNYLFKNCLLRTVVDKTSERFLGVRYDVQGKDGVDPFVTAEKQFVFFDTKRFLYDFAPDSLSQARGMADVEIAKAYPIDRRGRNRLEDGAPDVGAYEGK